MEYELLRRLKNQGFKQQGSGRDTSSFPAPTSDVCDMKEQGEFLEKYKAWKENMVYEPTLAELIIECGKPFSLIGFEEEKYGWQAFDSEDTASNSGDGKTPEEAVANLYLELHR